MCEDSDRRTGAKAKEQRGEDERLMENQERAGSAYVPAESRQIDQHSGPPWGGPSMRHIMEAGKAKEQGSQQDLRDNPVHDATSQAASSSQ